jgi:hypothetical protein
MNAGQSKDVDKLVLTTVNAPCKRDISAAALVECLATAELGSWPVHVAAFFTDVSTELILRFAQTHDVSESALAQAYFAMKSVTGESNPALEAKLGALAPAAR